MRKALYIIVSVVCICFMPMSVFAQISTAAELQSYYDEQKEILREQTENGEITSDEYDMRSHQLLIECQQIKNSSKAIAEETLKKQKSDTEENRMSAKQFLIESVSTERLMQYYADSQGVQKEELDKEPQFCYSNPIPMNDQESLMALNDGIMEATWLQQYIRAWIFVGYADGEPYGMFSVVNQKDGTFLLETVYPSVKQAQIYHDLLKLESCYTPSGITATTVVYSVLNESKWVSVNQIDMTNGTTKMLASGEKNVKVYYRALKLSSDNNLKLQAKRISGKVGGGNQWEMLTYQDTWNRAYYELYIRPYLMPAVAVLALGAVIAAVIMIRKRKQKKA